MEVANNKVEEKDKEDDEGALPGFRFHPTDEELVGFYLRRKVEKKPISIELIKHIDIYKYDPWDLPSKIYSYPFYYKASSSLDSFISFLFVFFFYFSFLVRLIVLLYRQCFSA